MMQPRQIELLAPARDADTAIEALRHGADAVYIGASSHGARSSAANSVADIGRVVDYAHQFRCRVYVTVNTLVYADELKSVEHLVSELYRAGVDALIVQDMSLLRLDLPPIALHASTQCDIRTPEKARFLAEAGFSQLVLPREMTLDEMHSIHTAVPDTPLEAFVHGALCVSYSGDCQAGFATQRRSANRGECPQICRHRFDLVDIHGNRLVESRHLLSMRDLNRSSLIGSMLEAGISSFKIEGRLKDAAYVKNTVGAYREAIDNAISCHPDRYRRTSIGKSRLTFTPDLAQSFNRGFTTYFTTAARPPEKMASTLTPKWTGLPVGKVKGVSAKGIVASLDTELANGDGLGFFNRTGTFTGFRANRVEGSLIVPAEPIEITKGTVLYRNHNRLREEALTGKTATRTIDVELTLRKAGEQVVIDASTEAGNSVSVACTANVQPAQKDQTEPHAKAMGKTGDTIFNLTKLTDLMAGDFMPISQLTALRREALETLRKAIEATHPFDRRKPENKNAKWPGENRLTYHDNVANPLAEKFYRDHGATHIEPAMETSSPRAGQCVMTTRYCLRREMDRCLLTEQGSKWPSELFLVSGPNRFKLLFDCRNCRMQLLLP